MGARALLMGSLLALGPWSQAAEAPPGHAATSALLTRARAAIAGGQWDDAEQLAQQATAREPARSEAWRVLGLARFRAGRWDDARAAFEEEGRREHDERAPEIAWFNIAGAEWKLGRYRDAERHYLRAVREDGLGALATLHAGLCAEADGRRARAIELYREAAAAARESGADAVAVRAGEQLRGAEEAEQARHRGEAWRLAKEGGAALRGRDPAAAVERLQQALVEAELGMMAARDRADLEYALGHALLEQGRTAAAVTAFRRAVAIDPRDPEYRYMLGLSLYRAAEGSSAAGEFRAALTAGLAADDAARARRYLGAIAAAGREDKPWSVFTSISGGYDSNYLGGREIANQVSTSGPSDSPELLADVEARGRIAGNVERGLYLGDRLGGLFYLAPAADNFSLLEEEAYIEGSWTPREWLRLGAAVTGYLDTSGLRTFGLYQTGGSLTLRAVFVEGERLATRVRYQHTIVDALQNGSNGLPDYRYMSGNRDELLLAEALYAGSFRLSLGYAFDYEGVGVESQAASSVLSLLCAPAAGSACGPAQTIDASPDSPLATHSTYRIPYSYLGNAITLDADGDLGAGFHLGAGARLEQRNYLADVVITPDPGHGYTRRRVDQRLVLDLSLRHEIALGIFARAAAWLLVSGSNIDFSRASTPYDFDNKNYRRVVATFDLLKDF